MSIKIRSEAPCDVVAIEALTAEAFRNASHTSCTEQYIVNALRNAGRLFLSLVAEDNGVIVGHVAISPVAISGGAAGWYGLGPISVAPKCQGQGVGSLLIEQALAALRSSGAAGCVLVGEPGYYGRFGFKAEPELVLPGVPSEYFQAISFHGGVPAGIVSFHKAFDVES